MDMDKKHAQRRMDSKGLAWVGFGRVGGWEESGEWYGRSVGAPDAGTLGARLTRSENDQMESPEKRRSRIHDRMIKGSKERNYEL